MPAMPKNSSDPLAGNSKYRSVRGGNVARLHPSLQVLHGCRGHIGYAACRQQDCLVLSLLPLAPCRKMMPPDCVASDRDCRLKEASA